MTTLMDHTPAADADVWELIEAEEFGVEEMEHKVWYEHKSRGRSFSHCDTCGWDSGQMPTGWAAMGAGQQHRQQATSGALVRGEVL